MTDTFKKTIESLVKLKLLMNHCYTCSHYAFQTKNVEEWNVRTSKMYPDAFTTLPYPTHVEDDNYKGFEGVNG